MTLEDWTEETRRMTWYGAIDGADLVGVVGLEYAGDAALFRHAYVLPDRQRQGVASVLHGRLEREVEGIERPRTRTPCFVTTTTYPRTGSNRR